MERSFSIHRRFLSRFGPRAAVAAGDATASITHADGIFSEWLTGIAGQFRPWLQRECEGQCLFCWFVVCFGCGILLFFQTDGTASPASPLLGAFIFLAVAFACRARLGFRRTALAAFAVCAGFLAGVSRMQIVEAPVLQRPVIEQMTGFIETIDHRTGGSARLVVLLKSIGTIAPNQLPQRARLSIRSGAGLSAGDMIETKVRLLPLPQPVRPSGYDFAQEAYFKGI